MSDVFVSGAPGVLYYLVDNAAETFLPPGFDLDNYYFEIGAPAIPYVGAGELFGTSSPIFQAAQATFYYGIPNVINSIVVSATQLVPSFDLGPIKLGGGILASLYFYGQTPDYNPPDTHRLQLQHQRAVGHPGLRRHLDQRQPAGCAQWGRPEQCGRGCDRGSRERRQGF